MRCRTRSKLRCKVDGRATFSLLHEPGGSGSPPGFVFPAPIALRCVNRHRTTATAVPECHLPAARHSRLREPTPAGTRLRITTCCSRASSNSRPSASRPNSVAAPIFRGSYSPPWSRAGRCYTHGSVRVRFFRALRGKTAHTNVVRRYCRRNAPTAYVLTIFFLPQRGTKN